MNFDDQKWDTVIKAKHDPFSFDIRQIIEYRDLIFLFVKRDMAIAYKQTLLGPLWYLIQPICTTIMCLIVFQNVANIGTEGIPPVLFYFAGTILWTFFGNLLTNEARVLSANKEIFGKVYFPRLTVPISVFCGELIKLIIQLVLFAPIYARYIINGHPNIISIKLLLLPVIILWTGIMAVGLGLIVSSITIRYRDLTKALSYFLSLFMYVTPVVYPLSEVSEKYRIFFKLNPVSALMECFRWVCFHTGIVSLRSVSYSIGCSIVFLTAGLILFNRNEKTFIDVI